MKDLEKFVQNNDWEIFTPNGWQDFKGIAKLKKRNVYLVTTETGKNIICSGGHSFIGKNNQKVLCRNSKNRIIKTSDGLEKVISIKRHSKSHVFDIVDVKNGNVFFGNGILHHNTHILEEFWASVIPSISSGKTSKILMVSTPNGVGNKFYEIFSGAENGSIPEWRASRIDWWDVPGRDEAWKKSMIAVLGSEEKFSQEFGNTFLDNDACAIGSILIEKFKREKKEPIWTSPDGEYTVFEYPNNEKLYVIGVDVGEGIGRAASVAQVLDVTNLQEIKQVAVYASTVIEPYHFANKLNIIGNSWGVAPMLIERNNCGAQVIDALHYKHGYEKIVSYSKISESEKYNRTRNMGVLSHTNIRFDGVQNMRYWVNHLQTVRINDARTISEFETFVRQPNGVYRKRNDNFFDDRIMSLVWALFILEPEICQQYFEIADYDNQHKPLKIFSNGYWEISNENYDLKDLSKEQNIVRPSYLDPKSPKMPTLTEFFEMDKYDTDVESLQSMGYQFFDPNV